MSSLLHHLRRVALAQRCSDLTDGELLEAFLTRRDGPCFEALVWRHGPLVLGVCRRVLRDPHDAEDAFQATFLVLVRRAAAVPRTAVAGWLYGVAYRTALAARRAAARRRARQRPEDDMPHPTTEPKEDWAELRPLLDRELSQLPEKYRTAAVLCDLEGRTRAEAARHLGVPEGTVSGRLTIARRMLAERLTRRGLTLSVAALSAALAPGAAAAAVPATLVAATVRAGEAVAAGAAAGVVPAPVAALADGVTNSLAAGSWKPLGVVLLAIPVFATGTAALVSQGGQSGNVVAVPPASPALTEPAQGPVVRLVERTDRAKLQGKWVLVSEEVNGLSKTDPSFADEVQFIFAGDRVTYRTRKVVIEGTYHIDSTRSPRAMDIVADNTPDMKFIYEVTDTRLTMCWTKLGPRPGGFDTATEPDGTILFVLEKR